jgi:hypothetical protein
VTSPLVDILKKPAVQRFEMLGVIGFGDRRQPPDNLGSSDRSQPILRVVQHISIGDAELVTQNRGLGQK